MSNRQQSEKSLQLIGFCFGNLLLGLPSRNRVFHPNEKQQCPEESHILQGVQYSINNCNKETLWQHLKFELSNCSYLSKFDEKLDKFFVLAVIIVEIIQYWSSDHLMQKLQQGEKNQRLKKLSTWKANFNFIEKSQATNQKESSKRAAEYEKNPSKALESNSPSH